MATQENVQESIKQGIEKIEMIFAPLINAVDMQIGKLQKANQDPSKYYDLDQDETINYFAVREVYVKAKNEAIEKYSIEMDKEIQRLENTPEVEGSSVGWEQIVFLVIKSALEDGVRIKVGNIQWDSTKPLGGKNSVFDDMRNISMRSIGIDPDSDLGKIVKDPFKAVIDLGGNVGSETEKTLNDVTKATEKALNDASKTTDKALSDVKRETDKALTDARKVTEKALQDTTRELGKVIPKVKLKIPKFKL
jgi:hypothetical protein